MAVAHIWPQWSTPLEAAKHYAGLKWKIFPCRLHTNPATGRVEKKPQLGIGWTEEATFDIKQIERWWAKWPEALVGHCPGESGHVVIDIDVKNGGRGEEQWEELTGSYLSHTMNSRTLHNGRHLWFKKRDSSDPVSYFKLDKNLEVRSDKVYVILPSPGSGYQWVGRREAMLMPNWLQARIDAHEAEATDKRTVDTEVDYETAKSKFLSRLRKGKLTSGDARWLKVHLLEQREIAKDNEQDRSGVMHRMECLLRDLGMSEGECFALVWRCGWNKFRERRNGEDQLSNEIGKVYDETEAATAERAAGFRIHTSEEFIADWRPDDWFVDGVLQRKYLYAMTGVTGHGKTAVAMRLALSVYEGSEWGGVVCDRGDVIYFAGENPDDVRSRWIAMSGVGVHFIVGTQISLREDIALIKAEVERLGIAPSLIVVDTKAAFFEDEDEDKNVAAIQQASDLRELTGLPSNPAVLVLCHPTKYAKNTEQLIPRGGGAFVAAIDGNLTCTVDDDSVITIEHTKLRGATFDPLQFNLEGCELPEKYTDTKGRRIKSVIVTTASEMEMERKSKERTDDEERVRKAMAEDPKASLADIAKKLWMFDKDGKPSKWKVQRILKRMEKGE